MIPTKQLTYSIKSKFLTFTCYLSAFFIICCVNWISKNFGDVTVDQILYHVQFGADNLIETDKKLVRDFLIKCIYLPLLLAVILMVMLDFRKKIVETILVIIGKVKIFINQYKASRYLSSVPFPIKLICVALLFAAYKFSLVSYIKDYVLYFGEDFYAENYINPKNISITPSNPKNLILVYVESLEATYANEEIFNQNLIKSVEPETLGGISFLRQHQLLGANWTIAGITATQCGVPLKAMLGGGERRNNDAFEYAKSFLPNIICLGDILKAHDYKNIFMGGASLNFAGKGNFFRSHGYDEVYGKEEFEKLYNNQLSTNNWGIFDDELLDIAKNKIDALEATGQRYNLTLLTLDTHQPEGHLSRGCRLRGVVHFKGIVKCSADMVSELVLHLKEKGYLKNTTIVVMGDHLAMTNPLIKKIEKEPHRYVFNNYISNVSELKKYREDIVHFDHFPSILESIGFNVEGGKLALGISGFNQSGNQNIPTNRIEELKNKSLIKSNSYQNFWTNNNF